MATSEVKYTNKNRMVATNILDTNTKGDISMAFVIAELTKRGISVSVPMTDNKRYDLVMDYNGKLYKMQVKTILYKQQEEILSFKTVSSNTTKTKGYYEKEYKSDEIDGFLAYCIELGKVYLAWQHEVPSGRISMRLGATKNNQRKKVRMAFEYELDRKLAEMDGRFTAMSLI
ncbi:group I intron-associated PD-(D/E)XK endonuclease [Pseudobacillus badius]|uniref:group I intron-associated PD-(D/E)XK endonuclease n=1 Tax=Bacillus badius TaxID=1455 RepID=UPI001E5F1900|nr:group I intron-associated PD-(D/E)XK endonuclease [Bacillus badius]